MLMAYMKLQWSDSRYSTIQWEPCFQQFLARKLLQYYSHIFYKTRLQMIVIVLIRAFTSYIIWSKRSSLAIMYDFVGYDNYWSSHYKRNRQNMYSFQAWISIATAICCTRSCLPSHRVYWVYWCHTNYFWPLSSPLVIIKKNPLRSLKENVLDDTILTHDWRLCICRLINFVICYFIMKIQ